MTKEEIKCFLSRYKLLNDRLIGIEKTLYDVKTHDFNYVKGFSQKTINDTILEKETIAAELEAIKAMISSIKELRAYYAVSYKYLYGLTLEEISENMIYCDTQIKRFINKGIEELSKRY